MTVKSIPVSDLDEAIRLLDECARSGGGFVFRGHSNPDWRITSTWSRFTSTPHRGCDPSIDDALLQFTVSLRTIGRLPAEMIANRRARLEYGRHYGVPSPLIDFTLSPYIALFFAFNTMRPKREATDEHVVVCALDVKALARGWADTCGQQDAFDAFLNENPKLFEHGYPENILKFLRFPASWNERMQRQMGVFIYDTLDYAERKSQDFEGYVHSISEPKDADTGAYSPTMTKFLIPGKCIGDCFSRLELMGINATRLYNDPAGAAGDVWNSYNFGPKLGFAWDLLIPPPDETKM